MKILIVMLFVMMCSSAAWCYPVTAPEGKTLKVHWAVLSAKPGKMQEMAAISARTVAKYTPNEKGSYSLYGAVDAQNPDLMRILEVYEDEEAYQVHRDSEGFKAFIEQRKPILESLKLLPVDPVVLEQKAQGTGKTVYMNLIQVKPECLEEFKAAITQEMTRAVAEDDGVLVMFATSEQGDRSNVIHTLEVYSDDEALNEYTHSAEYESFIKKTDSMTESRRGFENRPVNVTLSDKGLHMLTK